MAAKKPSPLRDRVRRFVNRLEGVATTEVPDMTPKQVARCIEYLVADGLAFPAHLNRRVVRYFASQVLADRWLEATKLKAYQDKQEEKVFLAPQVPDGRAPWSASAQPHYPTDADGRPLWKHTICSPSEIGLRRTNTHSDLY